MKKPKPKLTDQFVKSLKAPNGRVEIGDAICRGLSIRCTAARVKSWTYVYKTKGTAANPGATRRVTLGEYPAVSLSEARELADTYRKQRSAGADPHALQAQERVEQTAANVTFGELCDLYIAFQKGKGKLSWKTDDGYLSLAKAKFRKRTARSITKKELMNFVELIKAGEAEENGPLNRLRMSVARLRRMQKFKLTRKKVKEPKRREAGIPPSRSSANRTQSTLRTLWGWAVEKDHLSVNVLLGLEKVGGKETEKDRVLTAEELKTFLALLAAPDAVAVPAIRQALQVVLLTAQRPGEVAGMMLSELHDLDGERPHWIIPRLRTKNKKTEHTVPLSPAAVRLIGEALAISKKQADEAGKVKANDQAVFASRYGNVASLSRNSLSQALLAIVRKNGLAKFTPHDLRRTGATLAQSGRIPTDFVKALLNHNDKRVTGIYARWGMFDEKREAVMAIEAAVSLTTSAKC